VTFLAWINCAATGIDPQSWGWTEKNKIQSALTLPLCSQDHILNAICTSNMVKRLRAPAEPPSVFVEHEMASGHGQVAVVMIRVALHRQSAAAQPSFAGEEDRRPTIKEAKRSPPAGRKWCNERSMEMA
jgi:hypothetical protein